MPSLREKLEDLQNSPLLSRHRFNWLQMLWRMLLPLAVLIISILAFSPALGSGNVLAMLITGLLTVWALVGLYQVVRASFRDFIPKRRIDCYEAGIHYYDGEGGEVCLKWEEIAQVVVFSGGEIETTSLNVEWDANGITQVEESDTTESLLLLFKLFINLEAYVLVSQEGEMLSFTHMVSRTRKLIEIVEEKTLNLLLPQYTEKLRKEGEVVFGDYTLSKTQLEGRERIVSLADPYKWRTYRLGSADANYGWDRVLVVNPRKGKEVRFSLDQTPNFHVLRRLVTHPATGVKATYDNSVTAKLASVFMLFLIGVLLLCGLTAILIVAIM